MGTSISSGLQNSDQLLFRGKNRINAITLIGDGTNACNLYIHDGLNASGTKVVAKVKLAAGGVTNHIIFENPVLCDTGIYADITGTGAEYIVYFGG